MRKVHNYSPADIRMIKTMFQYKFSTADICKKFGLTIWEFYAIMRKSRPKSKKKKVSKWDELDRFGKQVLIEDLKCG